ncbi:MAG TPA: HEAT repeat domain-containing protein [Bacteroidota bacterium]|nr:HEAT repeat domain-containing protein [Bacteroidota bacterium]
MTHDDYRSLVFLAASGTVDDDERAVLDRHMAGCTECAGEFAALVRLHDALGAAHRAVEPDDRLLAEARQELRVALRAERARVRPWASLIESVRGGPAWRLALGGAFALACGILAGRTLFAPATDRDGAGGAPAIAIRASEPREEETRITNVHFVDHAAARGEVEFTFDAVTPVRMRGSIDDPKIQKVLTHAMLNEENPGVRLQAVSALTRGGAEAGENDVRSALVKALESDPNVGVRKEALNALRRLPFDAEIKKALLHTLVADGNPGLRVAAINALAAAPAGSAGLDSDILEVLKQKAETDDNNYIRVKARAVIQEARGQ